MYQQMMDTFRNYETLSLHKDPTPYQQKLLCELDAIRDRQRQLGARP